MYIFIDKKEKIGYVSKSKNAISRISGKKYYTLDYYTRKGYYETEEFIFVKGKFLKSRQGGERENGFKVKVI